MFVDLGKQNTCSEAILKRILLLMLLAMAAFPASAKCNHDCKMEQFYQQEKAALASGDSDLFEKLEREEYAFATPYERKQIEEGRAEAAVDTSRSRSEFNAERASNQAFLNNVQKQQTCKNATLGAIDAINRNDGTAGSSIRYQADACN